MGSTEEECASKDDKLDGIQPAHSDLTRLNPLRASTKILWNTQTRVRRWISASASASASCAMFSLSPKVLASYDESVVRGVRVRSRNLICWHSAVVLPLNGNVRNPRSRVTSKQDHLPKSTSKFVEKKDTKSSPHVAVILKSNKLPTLWSLNVRLTSHRNGLPTIAATTSHQRERTGLFF
uniref:Uncharacterized protein n=1 Tax=Vespula pensylvanica TaxID=30213 RepID=A0A834NQA3_VESPE|nr:hypothetical protein H0235_012158 [Vespula pensylvanica]